MYGHAREIALKLVDKIKDFEVKRTAQRSLRQGADMNLMVRAFHEVYGLPIVEPYNAREDFSHITKERLAMRFSLIVEEFMELCEAMDIRADVRFLYQDEEEHWVHTGKNITPQQHQTITDAQLHQIVRERCTEAIEQTDERCLPDIADATFDLKYVIIGFEYETGIHPQFCAEEGQASNMSKLNDDGTVLYREDGKVLKGPRYFKPDMARALKSWAMKDV
jgi:predicted HAD superfamily Cof-like phosphohydrolase